MAGGAWLHAMLHALMRRIPLRQSRGQLQSSTQHQKFRPTRQSHANHHNASLISIDAPLCHHTILNPPPHNPQSGPPNCYQFR